MREYLLKDVAFIKNGYAFDSKKYSNKGIPIIRIADIKEKIDLKNCVFINGKVDNEFLVKKGSLLIALSGATTGKMGVYFEDKIVYLNQRICSVYTKKEDVLQEYLVYFLKSMQKKIIKNSYGGAQPNISSRWIENIKIKVPDIRVQKKISKRLELLENNIDYRKKQLNYLKELSKSLFTRMFG
ncbi:restriction endonuclease subunit S, partial [Fusobacterium hwasookii]